MSMLDIQLFLKQATKLNQKLSADEELSYFKLIHSENISQDIKNLAINKIIQNHLLFVVTCAKKFAKNIEIQDLIQEGIIGMKTAILKYNENGNVKFLSYAVWYILQRIRKYVDSYSSVIYVPSIRKLEADKITHKLYSNDISDLNLSKAELLEYQTIINAINIESLNTVIPGFENEQKELIDNVADNSFVEEINQKNFNKKIDWILDELNEKELDILKQKYGMDNYKPSKFCDIAKTHGLCSVRISQINKKVLSKLRKKIKENKCDISDFY